MKDTVQPCESWRNAGTGFTFAQYDSGDMLHVIREAVFLYRDFPEDFAALQSRAMACDFSWGRSAREYLGIYGKITGKAWPEQDAAPKNEGEDENEAASPVSGSDQPNHPRKGSASSKGKQRSKQ